MADKDKILELALDHIHYYESRRGKSVGIDRDKDGNELTRGEYHIKHSTAKNLDPKYKNMEIDGYTAMIESDAGPAEEKRLAKLYLEKIMKESRVDFSGLTLGESVAFLSMNYNSGLKANKTTQKAFIFLANARNRNDPNLGLYIETAIGSIDLTSVAGEPSNGVMNRTKSHKQTARGALIVDATMKDSGKESVTAENRKEEREKIRAAAATSRRVVEQETAMLAKEFPKMALYSDGDKMIDPDFSTGGNVITEKEATEFSVRKQGPKSGLELNTFTSPSGEIRPVQQVEPTPKPEIPQGVN